MLLVGTSARGEGAMVPFWTCITPQRAVAVAAVVCVLVPASAGAIRVVIPCGRDATLFESCGCYASGAGEGLYSGQTQYFGARRALLWFAVDDSIPVRSHVDSVQLELHGDRMTVGSFVHTLHRVNADWGEGASVSLGGGGAPAAPGDATWTHRVYDTLEWTTPGGDFDSTPSASAAVGAVGTVRWGSTPEMVADVQSWVEDPSVNNGWILIGDESAGPSAKRFVSREHGTVADRPALIVDYTPSSAVESRTWTSIKGLYAPGPDAASPEGRR